MGSDVQGHDGFSVRLACRHSHLGSSVDALSLGRNERMTGLAQCTQREVSSLLIAEQVIGYYYYNVFCWSARTANGSLLLKAQNQDTISSTVTKDPSRYFLLFYSLFLKADDNYNYSPSRTCSFRPRNIALLAHPITSLI